MNLLAWLLVAAVFAIPLLASAAVLRAGYRRKSLLVKAVGFVVPPGIFFVAGVAFWSSAAARATAAGQYLCGAAGALLVGLIVVGPAVELAAILLVSVFFIPEDAA